MIDKISNATRAAIEAASAKSLPDNPSGRGMTPSAIRDAFWKPIVDSENSLAYEIDRVVGEANRDIGSLETNLNKEVSDRKTTDSAIDQKIAKNATAINNLEKNKVDESDVSTSEDDGTIAKRSNFGTLHAITKVIGNMGEDRRKTMLVNLGFFDAEMDAHKAEVDKTFNTLEAQIAGITTSYVIQGIPELEDNLSDIGANLKTGDKIFSIDKNIPDLWFESKNNTDGAETFVYKDEEGNERTIDLIVMETSYPYTIYGILHVIESNAVNFGDLETVLDSIIAYQEQLIGGDS